MTDTWNTLPLGAGGLVTGFNIADDDSLVCRTDVGNLYRWSGKATDITNPDDEWIPLLTLASLAGITNNPFPADVWGGLELVQAPNDATKMWAIFNSTSGLTASPIYYSSDSGDTWAATNLVSNNAFTNTPSGYSKTANYRIAVDPNNSSVVYVGLPITNGQTTGSWVATDGVTFATVKTDGVTPIAQTTVGAGVCGICFDKSSGTVVGIGGLTVTKRIILPVGGVDIYESNDGGLTFVSTGAATAFGTATFQVYTAVINSNGVYYAAVLGPNKLYRYSGVSGTWTNLAITGGAFVGQTLVIDPNDPTYLTSTGANGLRAGFTATNADTGNPPTWVGSTTQPYGNVTVSAPSYDLGYMTRIFGQGASSFFFATAIVMDSNGDTIISGNQSIFKKSGRLQYTAAPGTALTITTFGRGMEATVAQEAWRATDATYPVLGPQDIGLMNGGTFTTYPTDNIPGLIEETCSSIEESPSDGSFVVARITAQSGATSVADGSSYSTDGGDTWTAFPTSPTSLWSTHVTGSISGTTLTITAVNSGTIPFVGQEVYSGTSTDRGFISSFISVNPDGTGTYTLSASSTVASSSLLLQAANQAGQIIACDNDHHLIVPAGFSHGTFPVVTADCGTTWAACNGLPIGNWMFIAWFSTPLSKPLAFGFGTDIGTAWAAFKTGSTTVTIYKSTDYGANFASTANTVTVSANMTGIYLMAVPGHPGHLWLSGRFTGGSNTGLWQSTDYGDNWTAKTKPTTLADYMSIGAAATDADYPTIWFKGRSSASSKAIPYYIWYSKDAATSWTQFGSTGAAGQRADLPLRQQLYGTSSIRADRNIYPRLYCGCGQTGFAWYGTPTPTPIVQSDTSDGVTKRELEYLEIKLAKRLLENKKRKTLDAKQSLIDHSEATQVAIPVNVKELAGEISARIPVVSLKEKGQTFIGELPPEFDDDEDAMDAIIIAGLL